MIKVDFETWSRETGFRTKTYTLEENREMQLVKNGEVYMTQVGEFESISMDWNCDGDVYEMFGALFVDATGRKDFLTPENIVDMIALSGYEVFYNK